MKLLTLRLGNGATAAVRQDGDTLTEIPGFSDVGALLKEDPNWETTAKTAKGTTHSYDGADLVGVVPSPGKIICVGQNYRNHSRGRRSPTEHPDLGPGVHP